MGQGEEARTSVLSYLQYISVPFVAIVLLYRITRFYNTENKSLKGKVVFISGASSGVGEALAHCLYSHGCKVILASRRDNELVRVKKDLVAKAVNMQTHEPLIVHLDLAATNTIEQAVQKAYEEFGQIDILVNNGGISCRGDVLSTDIDVFSKLMNVNFFGAVVLTKAVLHKMVENKNGHIVFVSSVQGRIAIPDRSAYAASKHACQAFADSLRAEVKKHDINVSVLSPGYIKTALSMNALTGTGEQYGVMDATTAGGYTAEFVAEKIVNMILYKTNDIIMAPTTHKIAVILRCILPSLYFWIMSKRVK